MDFGINLKKLRKAKNLTQESLAECLNVSPQTISKWENGLSMPDVSLLPVLADYFQVSVDSLLMHDVSTRQEEMKALAQEIHALVDAGKVKDAYATLKASMGKWKLSVGMNHLLCWVTYQYAGETRGEERVRLLEEAAAQADRVISLDGGETGRTAQAKMTKCLCLKDLGRMKEALALAESLPSLYSTREIVLARISEGDIKKERIKTAMQYLDELKESISKEER